MKYLRSIIGILMGVTLAIVVIVAVEGINTVVNRPDDGRKLDEFLKSIKEDKKAMKEWVESMPESAVIVVLVAWQLGAFFGGGLAALVAGHWRRLHACVIGAFVLAGTVMNFRMMQAELGFTHPDYIIILGLLLPIPCSLLAGQLVSMMFPPRPAAEPPA